MQTTHRRVVQSPLLLSLFSTVLPLTPYTSPILWTAVDAVAAWALVRIWRYRAGVKTFSKDGQIAALYVLVYLLEALTIAALIGTYSTHISSSQALLCPLHRSKTHCACCHSCLRVEVSTITSLRITIHYNHDTGRASASLFTLACLLHLSLPSILLLIPLVLLNISRPVSRLANPQPFDASLKRALPLLGEFLGYTALLTVASTLVCGNFAWLERTWGSV